MDGKIHLILQECGVVVRQDRLCDSCKMANRMLNKRKTEFKNLTYCLKNSNMSQEELDEKLVLKKMQKRNAENREMYWRRKFEQECVEMERDEHQDFVAMLGNINPDKMTICVCYCHSSKRHLVQRVQMVIVETQSKFAITKFPSLH